MATGDNSADTTAAPFDGERVLLWMHPDTGFGAAFGYYTITPLWGPCWRFEDEHTVEAPAGALRWQPVPEAPTDPVVSEPDDEAGE